MRFFRSIILGLLAVSANAGAATCPTFAAGSLTYISDLNQLAAGCTPTASNLTMLPRAASAGTVDALTATYSPAVTLTDQTIVALVKTNGLNTTTTPSFAPNGLTARTIVARGGGALLAGDTGPIGYVLLLEYNLANTRWELLNPWMLQNGRASGINGTLTLTGVTSGAATIAAASTAGTPTLTLPTTTGVLLTDSSTATLTNKTLTAPVIATIVNSGTLTLPTSTDTLIGKATTDTLTNKTFDTAGSGNVFKINGTTISDKTGAGKAVLDVGPTLTSPIIANIAPNADFTLNQNSVEAFKSVQSGAVANTIYMEAGKVGIGTATVGANKLTIAGLTQINGVSGRSLFSNGATTGNAYWEIVNTGTNLKLGIESSVGGTLFTGVGAYEPFFGTLDAVAVHITSNGLSRLKVGSGAAIDLPGTSAAARSTTSPTSAINIYNGTAPVGTLTNGATLYSASGQLQAMDSAGVATKLTQGPCTTYTPTVTSGTGTFTTVSATGCYWQHGKKITFTITITVTTVGTAASTIVATLPVTATSVKFAGGGRATSGSGAMQQWFTSSTTAITILKFDNTFDGASGTVITVSGDYEAA